MLIESLLKYLCYCSCRRWGECSILLIFCSCSCYILFRMENELFLTLFGGVGRWSGLSYFLWLFFKQFVFWFFSRWAFIIQWIELNFILHGKWTAATVFICTTSITVVSTITVLGDHNNTSNNNCPAYSPCVFTVSLSHFLGVEVIAQILSCLIER